MPLRAEQTEALRIVGRWYSTGKCHRIDQLMHDHPEFASEAAHYYMHADNNMSPVGVVLDLIHRDVPGFSEAIMAADHRHSAIAPQELLVRRAKEQAANGRAA